METDRVAIVHFALRNKTRLAALRVRDFSKRDVMVIQTLLWPDEIRDPDFPDRPRDERPIPPTVASGSFVVRENVVELTAIAHQVSLMPQSQGHSARVILVGHSHDPCAAWTDAHGEPAVVIDVGSWAFERSTIAIAAGNAVAVFRIGPKV